jgi:F-type H+-transporting ATPase subunit delta
MAQLFSIARPYANAAFEYARDKEQLASWKSFLESAAMIMLDPAIKPLSNDQLLILCDDVLASVITSEQKNFLRALADNNRLIALPDISTLFNIGYAELQKISDVRLVSAVEIQDDLKQKLSLALSKRMKHAVTLHCEIDPTLIGGAMIHLGDHVIDGSISGKLKRLEEALTS